MEPIGGVTEDEENGGVELFDFCPCGGVVNGFCMVCGCFLSKQEIDKTNEIDKPYIEKWVI